MTHAEEFLGVVRATCDLIDPAHIEAIATGLASLKGRLFILGVGGSAANASHAVNDFRKLCGIEAYCPSDNVAELTARVNDEGWETAYAAWLQVSRIGPDDALLIFSVGGGDREAGVSVNLVRAIDAAFAVGARVYGVVGPDGGFTARTAHTVVKVPAPRARMTPISEAFQAVVWHALVSHPLLQKKAAKWEGMK